MSTERVLISSAPSMQARAVWGRAFELADSFEQHEMFAVVFDVLRTARHESGTLRDALLLGRRRVDDDPVDLVARRACAFLERTIAFMGGDGSKTPRSPVSTADAHRCSSISGSTASTIEPLRSRS